MNKRRVLIFSLSYFPHFVGGAEVAIKEITDRLGDTCDFDMVTLRFDKNLPREEKVGNIRVFRVGPVWGSGITPSSLNIVHKIAKYLFLLTGFLKAHKLYEENKYDIIWSMMASYNSFAALFLKKVCPDIKFLLTLQEGDPIPYIKRRALPLWPLFKKIFTKADAIQTISQYLAHFAHEMGARCPVVVVPNGVDVKRFAHEYTSDELSKAKLKINKQDGDITLITTSRLVTKNSVDTVIKALPLLPREVKFVILGSGPLLSTLKKEVEILGVENRVLWLGHVSHNEMPKYLKASDIFIRTPISEGFGNSYVEAMASGLPCIATPVGGILDFIKERQTGIYADVEHPESVADAVMSLIRDEDLVSTIKRNAFDMVKAKYDWGTIAESMRRLFVGL